MKAHAAVYRQQATVGWARIDMVLALYDTAIDRLEKAIATLKRGDKKAAGPMLDRVVLLVGGLVAGVRPDPTDKTTTNILRLYEFVVFSLRTRELPRAEGAMTVLRKLQEGFQGIRQEAIRLEREGLIPPIDLAQSVRTMA